MSVDHTDLPIRIQRAGGLPVFNRSLQRTLELIRSDAPMAEIAAAVEYDPGMASRVLRLANSAYYGMSREVSTLKMAMVLLGVRSLRNMILSIGIVEILNDEADGSYVTPDFRHHSFVTGRAATMLVRLHRLPFSGEELVAGLVHDVGKLVLLRAFPERVAEHAERLSGLRGPELVALERETFGISHCQSGAWAAQEWRLPTEIHDSILRHHEPPAEIDLAAIAEAADQLAHFFVEQLEDDCLPPSWSQHRLLSHPHLTVGSIAEELAAEVDSVF